MKTLTAILGTVVGTFGPCYAQADALPPHDDSLIRYEACLFNVTDQALVDGGPETVFGRADELCAHYFEKYKQGPVVSYMTRFSMGGQDYVNGLLDKERDEVKVRFLKTLRLIEDVRSE